VWDDCRGDSASYPIDPRQGTFAGSDAFAPAHTQCPILLSHARLLIVTLAIY